MTEGKRTFEAIIPNLENAQSAAVGAVRQVVPRRLMTWVWGATNYTLGTVVD